MSMFRIVNREGDMLADADSLDGATEIVRRAPPGRYHIDEISVEALPSGHTARRWGIILKSEDGTIIEEPDPWDECPPLRRAKPSRTMSQAYFAHISALGSIRYGQIPGSIGVLEALDKPMPIGEAHCTTWDEKGLAVWTIRIGKQEIPGRRVIVDREFTPRQ